jgi:hypothetical protein
MRKLLKTAIVVLVLGCAGYSFMVWHNNRPLAAPAQADLAAALDRSIAWLDAHEQTIMSSTNQMLWWMIQQSAQYSAEPRLRELAAMYKQQRSIKAHGNMWRQLFYPNTWNPIRFEDIASLPYYNQHFLYAITCDPDLGRIPQISAQNSSAFCNQHRLSPACVTHQLMGIRFLQESGCGNAEQLRDTVKQLQRRIRRQLTWDPRVVDVYLQRVMMLAESGAAATIKPVWLQRVLDAQQSDGGWGNFQPLIPVGSGRYLGLGHRGFTIQRPASNFHATAQGVLLLSILTATDNPV